MSVCLITRWKENTIHFLLDRTFLTCFQWVLRPGASGWARRVLTWLQPGSCLEPRSVSRCSVLTRSLEHAVPRACGIEHFRVKMSHFLSTVGMAPWDVFLVLQKAVAARGEVGPPKANAKKEKRDQKRLSRVSSEVWESKKHTSLAEKLVVE